MSSTTFTNFRTRFGTPVKVLAATDEHVVLRFLPDQSHTASTQTIDTEFFDELVNRGDLVALADDAENN